MVVLFTGPIPVCAGFKQSKKQQQQQKKQDKMFLDALHFPLINET